MYDQTMSQRRPDPSMGVYFYKRTFSDTSTPRTLISGRVTSPCLGDESTDSPRTVTF